MCKTVKTVFAVIPSEAAAASSAERKPVIGKMQGSIVDAPAAKSDSFEPVLLNGFALSK